MSDFTLDDLLIDTEAHRDKVARQVDEIFGAVVDPEVEAGTGDQDTEETEGRQGSAASDNLTEEAVSNLIETASQPRPTPLRTKEDLGEDTEQGSADAGTRSPARRTAPLDQQFRDAIEGYRDGASAPRGIGEARRRKSRGVRVFDTN